MAQVAKSFYMTLLLVGLTALLSIIYSMYLGRLMVTTHGPLIDATMEIKYELAISHLELEERLAGDMSVEIKSIRHHLDEAKWYAMAMLEGGTNHEGTFIELEAAGLRLAIHGLLENINKFEGQIMHRLSIVGEKAGTASDADFDAVFETLLASADGVETSLQQALSDELFELDVTHVVVILMILFLVYYTIIKFRHHDASEIRLRKRLEEQSMLDGLTNIPNRRSFDMHLSQEWQHCLRAETPLSLLLCDIDYFKLYNDSLGHLAGDECLRQVGRCLKQVVKRPTDFVARYGGEEFVFVLPSTDEQGALEVAENVHRLLLACEIKHGASDISEYITMSIGIVTVIPSQHASPTQLIESADTRLYAAKEQGRNRSVADEAMQGRVEQAVAALC